MDKDKFGQFIQFLQARLTHWTNFQIANNISDKWDAALSLFEPCLPQQFRHFGQFEYFPPQLNNDECCVILLNHVSDMDWCILMFLMHNSRLKRDVKRLPSSSQPALIKKDRNDNDYDHNNDNEKELLTPHKTIYPTAFTHKYFENVPLIGDVVKKHLIGLYKGITEEEMIANIKQRMREGVNTFILFPEGVIHSKENHKQSQTYWNEQQMKLKSCDNTFANANCSNNDAKNVAEEYPFTNCLAPKYRCWNAVVNALGPKLKYICDLTLLYPNYQPWEHSWNYDVNPSISYSYTFGKIPIIFTHTKIIEIKAGDSEWKAWLNNDNLLALWKKKEKRLLFLRKQEIKWKKEIYAQAYKSESRAIFLPERKI